MPASDERRPACPAAGCGPGRRRLQDRLTNSATVVSAISLPRPITTRWSAVCAISASRWLDTSTVRPSAASVCMSVRIQTMPSGSSPLTGSSNSSTGGSPSSAAAMPSRWLMPSEKPPAFLSAAVLSPTMSSTSSTRPIGDAIGRGHPPQVGARRAVGMCPLGVEQRTDRAQRVRQLLVSLAVDGRGACRRAVQPKDHPHRGGFACAVRARGTR